MLSELPATVGTEDITFERFEDPDERRSLFLMGTLISLIAEEVLKLLKAPAMFLTIVKLILLLVLLIWCLNVVGFVGRPWIDIRI